MVELLFCDFFFAMAGDYIGVQGDWKESDRGFGGLLWYRLRPASLRPAGIAQKSCLIRLKYEQCPALR
ncbi:hypothetical protein [Marinobacterium aestuariivivens]|uniref:Uncharacterized protein n=1 Tax=Marinobacterium aestuariivivens TaxID=1698799 RepID=A0ABW1ZY74_9GAMM